MNCKICNQVIGFHYFKNVNEKLRREQLCFNCNYWNEKVAIKDNPNVVRVDGVQYVIGTGNEPISSFRGFGGRKFEIEFFDGWVVETTDLWCNGTIPFYFKNLLPDNAKFIKQKKFYELLK